MEHDLSEDPRLTKKYDLAISLEVVEHLSSESANMFIACFTNMSDIVLFSAAIPGQGGENHINEQWPEYWSGLFNERGYVGLNFARRRVWNDRRIPF